MSQISRVTTWASGQILTAAALNGEFNNLINAWNNIDNASSSWTKQSVSGTLAVTGATTLNSTLGVTGLTTLAAGTVGAPSVNFGDSATGFYRSALNSVALAINGAAGVNFTTTTVDVSGFTQLNLPNGTVGAPGLTWSSDTNSGLYRIGSHDFGFSTNGTKVWEANSSQVFSLTNALLPASGGTGLTSKVMRTGTYTGNGSTNTVAHGLGATPDLVIISVTGTGNNIGEIFITGMTNSHDLNGNNQTNAITAVDGTNITLGANAAVNSNSVAYAFVVFKMQ